MDFILGEGQINKTTITGKYERSSTDNSKPKGQEYRLSTGNGEGEGSHVHKYMVHPECLHPPYRSR